MQIQPAPSKVTGTRAKSSCLLIHAEASLALSVPLYLSIASTWVEWLFSITPLPGAAAREAAVEVGRALEAAEEHEATAGEW